VGSTDFVSPISSSDGDQVKLGVDDGSFDGTLDFFGTFPAQTQMTFLVSDDDVGLKSGSLTGLGLLLDGLDFANFFLQFVLGESVNNLTFFDGN
jgi:hypothetical protein